MFADLGLPDVLLSAVLDMGFESPSPIQAKTIPLALEGKDLIGLSQTGSGKTAAFALPTLAGIDAHLAEPQALIICPTRELAVQVCEEVFRLGCKIKGLRALPVYGGAPIDRQLKGLRKGAHIVVGTPGRLLDHLKRRSFDPRNIKTVILDEADRMLDMGFQEEMEELLAALPQDRQTMFFSATMNRRVSRLIDNFGKKPETIEIERKSLTVDAIDQSCYEVRQRSKVEVLSRLLDIDPPRLALVFCNTKRLVDEVTEGLLARGYAADRLHGDMTQQMRERVLARFRESTIEVLIATDVAARGLDVDDIDLVVNYEIPHDPEDYVHRIGRTGRAGRSGRAVSFVFGRDIYRLQTIEKYTRQSIRRERVPSQEQVEGKRADKLFQTIQERLESGKLGDYQSYLDRLLEQGHTATDIANAAFTLLRESTTREGEFIAEDKQKEAFANEKQRSSWRDEKRDRKERPERERKSRPERNNSKGMACLFMNIGKAQHIKPGDIAGMIYRECKVPDGSLGKITIFPKHTLVDVSEEVSGDVINGLKDAKIRGRSFKVDLDRRG
ncbi:MAG: DEAD/DEAH box helicase [Verrucomicrobia bacterium]|jgi:ATP-dependent RNA helicase DeaD|nr:DEAD/DEAH box helicase [Verrucomicrobiota bacterium]MDA7664438.1 DEAD/DEAH box helicase [Akkermansiaceae bacterium]MDA7937238.1 DEAD/DEAH box helicase [bacterium]MBT6165846.1 DEAD/DEAH box helicase [Verrucomicrobiota bacterium]MBT6399897.1 DEAD/DEAH box helicase [Verrucomicrobiota bacterium]